MNLVKLMMIAMLNGTLALVGCGGGGDTDPDSGTDSSTDAMTNGGATVDDGVYDLLCAIVIPIPIVSTLTTKVSGEFQSGVATDVTTQVAIAIVAEAIDALNMVTPEGDPAATDFVEVIIQVTGGTPTEITHMVEGLPTAPVSNYVTDEITTSITPDMGVSEVSFSVVGFSTAISNLPALPEIPENGIVSLSQDAAACLDENMMSTLLLADGSADIAFAVTAAQ